jgi:hypothetical protein
MRKVVIRCAAIGTVSAHGSGKNNGRHQNRPPPVTKLSAQIAVPIAPKDNVVHGDLSGRMFPTKP